MNRSSFGSSRSVRAVLSLIFKFQFLSIDDITIHKIRAIHGDSEEVVKKIGEVCGYVFEAPGGRGPGTGTFRGISCR